MIYSIALTIIVSVGFYFVAKAKEDNNKINRA